MVTVKLMGGLGNQMFQYAIGRSLAHDLNEELILDISFYDRIHTNATPRHYELCHLNIQGDVLRRGCLSRYLKYFEGLFVHYCPIFFQKYILEQEHTYTPSLIRNGKNLYLDGYWQCEKYFQHNSDIIRHDFQVTRRQSDINKKWSDVILHSSSVCLHVRRGDYVTNPEANQVHGTQGPGYYVSAITYISNIVENPVFFVFSDDMEWAKANIPISHGVYYMDHNGPGEDYEDLRLMMQCKYYIIANSSFSWWGAWLGGYKDKIVVCPKNWFNDLEMKTDIIPDSWVKM